MLLIFFSLITVYNIDAEFWDKYFAEQISILIAIIIINPVL